MDRFRAPAHDDERLTCPSCGDKSLPDEGADCPRDHNHQVCPICGYCYNCYKPVDLIQQEMDEEEQQE